MNSWRSATITTHPNASQNGVENVKKIECSIGGMDAKGRRTDWKPTTIDRQTGDILCVSILRGCILCTIFFLKMLDNAIENCTWSAHSWCSPPFKNYSYIFDGFLVACCYMGVLSEEHKALISENWPEQIFKSVTNQYCKIFQKLTWHSFVNGVLDRKQHFSFSSCCFCFWT